MSYYKPDLPPVVCKDGFQMSVQASRNHCCSPRQDEGPYTAVEVGFPSKEEPLLMEFVQDPKRPTKTVYLKVPISVVLQVITKHGGLVEGKLPPWIEYRPH